MGFYAFYIACISGQAGLCSETVVFVFVSKSITSMNLNHFGFHLDILNFVQNCTLYL